MSFQERTGMSSMVAGMNLGKFLTTLKASSSKRGAVVLF